MNSGRLVCVLPIGPFGDNDMEGIQSVAPAVRVLGSMQACWAVLGIG